MMGVREAHDLGQVRPVKKRAGEDTVGRMDASAIVLAGGSSRRFGRDKARVELAGVPLLERVLDAARAAGDDLVVVADRADKYALEGVRQLADHRPGLGPLGGLHTGLGAARHARAFLLGCDTPLLQPALLRRLRAEPGDADAVVPFQPHRGKPETHHAFPLHALYHRCCLPAVEALVAEDRLAMKALLDRIEVRWVPLEALREADPDLRSFLNVNTPAHLARAEALLRAAPSPRRGAG